MIAIVDNDVMAKLTRFSLLAAFVGYLQKRKLALELQPAIDGTFDLAGKTGDLSKLKNVACRNELAAVAAKASRIKLNAAGSQLLQSCHLVEGIDPGDAIWLSVGASDPNSTVFTGDKRALRAVARDGACKQIVAQLAGRVVCLEQLVMDLFDEVGYAVVRAGVRNAPDADPSTSSAFPDQLTKRAEASAKLTVQVDALRAGTGLLLRP